MADTLAATEVVATVNVAVLASAGTVTMEGTDPLVELEVSEIAKPPGPACPFNVSVAVEDTEPTTTLGARLKPVKAAGLMVMVAIWDEAPCEAVIVAGVAAFTPDVAIVNVAELAPDGMAIVAGTIAEVLLEARLMVTPPEAAVPERLTVPVAAPPEITEVGEIVRPES